MSEKPKGPPKIDLDSVLSEDWDEGNPSAEIQQVDIASGDAPEESSGVTAPAAAVASPRPGEAKGAAASPEERILRLRADFENYRKRMQREASEIRRRGAERLVEKLLPVLDNLQRALAEFGDRDDPFREGVRLIRRQFQQILSDSGLEPIRAVGEDFDPRYHEAVAREEGSQLPADLVVEEIQTGYKFHGRLLRPSKVKVVVHPSEAGMPPGHSEEPSNEPGAPEVPESP